MRFRIDLAYDGTNFRGWATQPQLRTVQGELERALGTICQTPISLTVAGRTDAGVHALEQVAHFDADCIVLDQCDQGSEKLARRINKLLALQAKHDGMRGGDIMVRKVFPVSAAFDARFSALWRSYRYLVADSLEAQSPLTTRYVAATVPLDVERMMEASQALLGEHDFLSFCKPREGATTIRTLHQFDITRRGDGLVEFTVRADAFCHSMVRSLVGATVDVGSGSREANHLRRLIASPGRQVAARLMPPHGLALAHIAYPDTERGLKEQSQNARRVRTLADVPKK